jgi:nitrite reductase/ring-hydroxylating ferredoxin subunit
LTTFRAQDVAAQAGLANKPDSIANKPDKSDRKSVSLQEARQLRNAPPPYPFGWFVVALCRELGKGEVLTRQFMDREIVIYRTESGVVCAAEAYCPHLGAHLGHGGKVLGEELRCPLHRFRFAVNGSCVYSPTGTPPPAARLGLLEVREIHGAIFVWHGPAGVVPWEIERLDGDDSDWHDLGHSFRRVHNHPQELAENAIDITHLSALHEFGNVRLVEPATFDGPRLRVRYTLTQPTPWKSGVNVEMLIRADGLGFAVNEVEVGHWSMRLFGFTTPVGERETNHYLFVSVRKRGRSLAGKAMWRVIEKAAGPVILHGMISQVKQDESIWNYKKYLRRPAVAEGDGPIHAYRKWASQFYPEGADW